MSAARTDTARDALFVSDADVARMCRMTAADLGATLDERIFDGGE